MQIQLQPLRERREDILVLAHHFIKKFCHELGLKPKRLSQEVAQIFLNYDWPGNVRDLRNLLREILITTDQEIIYSEHIHLNSQSNSHKNSEKILTLAEMEQQYIYKILQLTGYNKKQTAKLLGISLNTLKRKMRLNSY